MMSNCCLLCFKPLDGKTDYHPHCSRRFFGVFPPPVLEVTLGDLQEYAAKSVLERITVTGVQKKLSLGISSRGKTSRFTIVGFEGNFILKPPVEEYPFLPENEAVVMRLAQRMGIPVIPHSLIYLASGERAFISRRIDRDKKGQKLAMEDFCQLSERLTEDKYKGSIERVGKLLLRYSVFPGLDAVDLFERVVFNHICGNADMHLKNYSLIETPEGMRLSPAYDLVATVLAIPDDPEESALTLNGKKSKLKREDFNALGKLLRIDSTICEKIYRKFSLQRYAMTGYAERFSLLPEHMRSTLCKLIEKRMETFN